MKKLVLCLSICVFMTPALALTPDQIAQQQLVIQQQQQQALQNEQNRLQVEEAQRIRTAHETAEKTQKSATTASNAEEDCPKFTNILVYGNERFSDSRIAEITDSYLGRCVNRVNMENIQKELTALYIDRKYTLARVYFDQKNSKLTKTDCDIIFIIELFPKFHKIQSTPVIGNKLPFCCAVSCNINRVFFSINHKRGWWNTIDRESP